MRREPFARLRLLSLVGLLLAPGSWSCASPEQLGSPLLDGGGGSRLDGAGPVKDHRLGRACSHDADCPPDSVCSSEQFVDNLRALARASGTCRPDRSRPRLELSVEPVTFDGHVRASLDASDNRWLSTIRLRWEGVEVAHDRPEGPHGALAVSLLMGADRFDGELVASAVDAAGNEAVESVIVRRPRLTEVVPDAPVYTLPESTVSLSVRSVTGDHRQLLSSGKCPLPEDARPPEWNDTDGNGIQDWLDPTFVGDLTCDANNCAVRPSECARVLAELFHATRVDWVYPYPSRFSCAQPSVDEWATRTESCSLFDDLSACPEVADAYAGVWEVYPEEAVLPAFLCELHAAGLPATPTLHPDLPDLGWRGHSGATRAEGRMEDVFGCPIAAPWVPDGRPWGCANRPEHQDRLLTYARRNLGYGAEVVQLDDAEGNSAAAQWATATGAVAPDDCPSHNSNSGCFCAECALGFHRHGPIPDPAVDGWTNGFVQRFLAERSFTAVLVGASTDSDAFVVGTAEGDWGIGPGVVRLGDHEAHVADPGIVWSVRYDATSGDLTLRADGVPVHTSATPLAPLARTTAAGDLSIPAPGVEGYPAGILAELVVFDAALDTGVLAGLEAALLDRYTGEAPGDDTPRPGRGNRTAPQALAPGRQPPARVVAGLALRPARTRPGRTGRRPRS